VLLLGVDVLLLLLYVMSLLLLIPEEECQIQIERWCERREEA
jgi:hypothetical protein